MTATLKKIGGSLAIIIPKALSEGLAAGESIELTEQDGGILMKRKQRRAKRSIDAIVKQIDSKTYDLLREEFGNERPMGREIW